MPAHVDEWLIEEDVRRDVERAVKVGKRIAGRRFGVAVGWLSGVNPSSVVVAVTSSVGSCCRTSGGVNVDASG